MNNKADILNELQALDSALPGASGPVFTVPKDYFNQLPEAILAKVKRAAEVENELAEIAPSLLEARKSLTYRAPAGYFEENLQNLDFVFAEPKSPVLDLIEKKMPFDVPAGYFQNLEVAPPVPQQAKVVPMRTRVMRWAAAAAIIGILSLAGYNYFQQDQEAAYAANRDTAAGQTAVVVKDAELETALNQVSLNELETFIENVETPAKKQVTASKASSSIEKELRDIPMQDLEMFLDQVPTGDEELALID